MQDLAYLKVHGRIILVLRRPTKYGVALKRRKTGLLGSFLEDEFKYFEEEDEISKATLAKLLAGKVIKL